jgi:hypothetical protein
MIMPARGWACPDIRQPGIPRVMNQDAGVIVFIGK